MSKLRAPGGSCSSGQAGDAHALAVIATSLGMAPSTPGPGRLQARRTSGCTLLVCPARQMPGTPAASRRTEAASTAAWVWAHSSTRWPRAT